MARSEARIHDLEQQQKEIEDKLAAADAQEVVRLSAQYEQVQKDIEAEMQNWEKLSEEL